MRMTWKVGLSIGAILLIVAGLYNASFGVVYYDIYYANGTKGGPCQFACTVPYNVGTTVIFSGYPIWSPPSWSNVNYTATTCTTTTTTYTPQNPPPSCLYPPADSSVDYGRNYGGVFLTLLGGLVAVVVVRAKTEPAMDSPIPKDAIESPGGNS